MKNSFYPPIELVLTVITTVVMVLIVQWEWSLYKQLNYQPSNKTEVMPTISIQCKNGAFFGRTIDPNGDQMFLQKDIDRACGT